MRISKNILIIILIAVLLALGVWLGMSLSDSENSKYSAVYLSTGDIYFGEFSRWPKPHITNAWYLERGANAENQPQIGVVPMKAVFWAPAEHLYLNPKQIIFRTRLRSDSPIVQAMENPTGQPPGPTGGPSGTSTAP